MSDYPAAFAAFKTQYDNHPGVLAIEERGMLSQGFMIFFDCNTFDPSSVPMLFNGFQVSVYDVRSQLILYENLKSQTDSSDPNSILEQEIVRLRDMLVKVDIATANRIIFLDIDGVLNSNQYFKSKFYKDSTADLSDAQVMMTEMHHMIDPDGVLLINRLVDESKAQVVLSSTWRGKFSPVEMTKLLKGRGATFTIIASTPKLFGKISARIPRGNEIKAYLKSLPKQPEAFVILDDLSDMLELKTNLIMTSDKTGITELDVQRALNMLGVKL